MLSEEFIVATADYYGEYTLDDFAELLGVSALDVVGALADIIENMNLKEVEEEMGWDDGQTDYEEATE